MSKPDESSVEGVVEDQPSREVAKRDKPKRGQGNGLYTPFTSETAKAASQKSAEIQKMRKQMFREGYNAAMGDAGALIAKMQMEEIIRVSKLRAGHPDRLKLLAQLGEKTLDRLMGKASVSVEHEGDVGISHKIAQLAEAE